MQACAKKLEWDRKKAQRPDLRRPSTDCGLTWPGCTTGSSGHAGNQPIVRDDELIVTGLAPIGTADRVVIIADAVVILPRAPVISGMTRLTSGMVR